MRGLLSLHLYHMVFSGPSTKGVAISVHAFVVPSLAGVRTGTSSQKLLQKDEETIGIIHALDSWFNYGGQENHAA